MKSNDDLLVSEFHVKKYYQCINIYIIKMMVPHPAFPETQVYKDQYPILCLMLTLSSATRQTWLQLTQAETAYLRSCIPPLLRRCLCADVFAWENWRRHESKRHYKLDT